MEPDRKWLDQTDVAKLRQTITGLLAKWGLIAILPAIAILAIVLLAANGGALVFLFNLLFGFAKQYEFFYQTMGMDDAWSTVLARLMQFVTALGWVPLLIYFPRRRLDLQNVGIFLLGFLAIYVANPLLKAVAGNDVCFDQKTGQPIKWYVIEGDGKITLYDSDGFDRSGVRKRITTTQICQTYYAQKHGALPRLLTADPKTLVFFNPDGSARIWYDRDAVGKYRLFDAPGFDPNTGVKLAPVTPQVRDEIAKTVEHRDVSGGRGKSGDAEPRKRRSARNQAADSDPEEQYDSGWARSHAPVPPPRPRWRRCTPQPSGGSVCTID